MSDISSASGASRELIRAQRQWLLNASERLNLSPTQMAKQAGLTPTTLTRLANDPNHPHALSATTINKIVTKFAIPAPVAPDFGVFQDAVALAVMALHREGALQLATPEAVSKAVLDLAGWLVKGAGNGPEQIDTIASFEAERLRRQRST